MREHKVIKIFRDKFTEKIYKKGDSYCHDDANRIAFLIEKNFIEGASEIEAPSFDVAEYNELQLRTKKEIIELLTQKDIKFNKSSTKEELIQLLIGGE